MMYHGKQGVCSADWVGHMFRAILTASIAAVLPGGDVWADSTIGQAVAAIDRLLDESWQRQQITPAARSGDTDTTTTTAYSRVLAVSSGCGSRL